MDKENAQMLFVSIFYNKNRYPAQKNSINPHFKHHFWLIFLTKNFIFKFQISCEIKVEFLWNSNSSYFYGVRLLWKNFPAFPRTGPELRVWLGLAVEEIHCGQTTESRPPSTHSPFQPGTAFTVCWQQRQTEHSGGAHFPHKMRVNGRTARG